MITNGIRISDEKNGMCIPLHEILAEILEGNKLNWSILYLYSMGKLGEGRSIPVFEKQIRDSENGLLIKWDDLLILSQKFYQIIDIIIIGSENSNLLKRYENDREMYETCDVVIEMIDGGFWEVFSKDESLIQRLSKKFQDTLSLTSDFEK